MSQLPSLLSHLLLGGAVLAITAASVEAQAPTQSYLTVDAQNLGVLKFNMQSPLQQAGRVVLIPFVGLEPRTPIPNSSDTQQQADYDEFLVTSVLPGLDEANNAPATNLPAILTDLDIQGGLPSALNVIPPKIIEDALKNLATSGDPLGDLNVHSQPPASSGAKTEWNAEFWGTSQGDRIINWPQTVADITNPNRDRTVIDREALFVALADYQTSVLTNTTISAQEHGTLMNLLRQGLIKAKLWVISVFVPNTGSSPSLPPVPDFGAPTVTELNINEGSAGNVTLVSVRLDPPHNTFDPYFHVTTGGTQIELELANEEVQTVLNPWAMPTDLFVAFPTDNGGVVSVGVEEIITSPVYSGPSRSGVFVRATVPSGLESFGALSVLRFEVTPHGIQAVPLLFLSPDESTTTFAYFLSLREPGVQPVIPAPTITATIEAVRTILYGN